MALATLRPETMSSSGSLKRNRLVLWLMSSTSSSFKVMKPWSPPVNAFFGSLAGLVARPALAATSLALALACAAPLPDGQKK
jgi:hypothetical protein